MSPSHHLVRPERAGQTRGPRGILKRCAICVSLWSRTSQTTAGTLCYVADIQPGGSAALQGGVEIGDKILAIDRQSVAGLSLADVGARMGGPEGSYVTLGLTRTTSVLFGPDTEEHVEVSICRGRRARGGFMGGGGVEALAPHSFADMQPLSQMTAAAHTQQEWVESAARGGGWGGAAGTGVVATQSKISSPVSGDLFPPLEVEKCVCVCVSVSVSVSVSVCLYVCL